MSLAAFEVYVRLIWPLQRRFASRQDESYAAKILAMMRNQFGGHAVKED